MVEDRMGRTRGFLKETNKDKKIATVTYLRRVDYRGIANDQEFVEYLQSRFDNVLVAEFTSNTSFAEHFATMALTDLLISIHGAGLTNMMFMKPGSVLIEMFPFMWFKRVYEPMSQRFGIKHFVWNNPYKNKNLYRPVNFHCYEAMKDKNVPEDCYPGSITDYIPKFDKCDKYCITTSDTWVDFDSFDVVLQKAIGALKLSPKEKKN